MTIELEIPDALAIDARHPLDPLSPSEISLASAICRGADGYRSSILFSSVTLQEPDRATTVTNQTATDGFERVARVILRDVESRETIVAVVDLRAQTVTSWEAFTDRVPAMITEQFMKVMDAVRNDPRWQAALARRGVTDTSEVWVEPWPSGAAPAPAGEEHRLLVRPLTFVAAAVGENGYARPVEGLDVAVDLDTCEVVSVEDLAVVPIPVHPGNYAPGLVGADDNWTRVVAPRDDLKTIDITQPDGASFEVDGWHVRWQKWDFRVGFTSREGLTLHQVSFQDGDELRPIIHRASLSEMVVPYGDPHPTHRYKSVFDEGEGGMGATVNSLTLGCDCLGEIRYFDVVNTTAAGEPDIVTNGICMHEEDDGVAWKHTEFRTTAAHVRRARKLVISSFSTLGNYDYGFFWYLGVDGSIEFEVKLTGILSTGAVAPDEQPAHGVTVAPGLYGPHHQHFFNVRLDMAVDGPGNSVYEVDSVPAPPGLNPDGTSWVTKRTLLADETMAARDVDNSTARTWVVVNPNKTTALGGHPGYQLVAGQSPAPMYTPESHAGRRATFTFHPLWVTRYDPTEQFASGEWVYGNPDTVGVPEYAEAGRNLDNEDVVLWCTVGAHHVVRPEDWPVMPVSRVGFHLRPSGFFSMNPALDLPESTAKHCH